ncbi:MAG: N-acetyl-D-Glu racemase DgcA [Pseudomonadota bacterium]
MRRFEVRAERWPLPIPFVIARMAQTHGEVVVVELSQEGATGRGEADRADAHDPNHVPVVEEIEAMRAALEGGVDRGTLQGLMPPGPARSAIDTALWDLDAKLRGRPVWERAGLPDVLRPVTTVFTIGLDTPERMAAKAAANLDRPVLKLKLGGEGDPDRVAAVRAVAPQARISVDANTGWTEAQLHEFMPLLKAHRVELIEQPFPPGQDALLDGVDRAVPIAADESCLDRSTLPDLVGRYDYINIKIDKAGGLTEALALAREAKAAGFGIMVGCNIGTSLAMAPGMVVAQLATFVDLDGPLLLSEDREHGLIYDGGIVFPPDPALWG